MTLHKVKESNIPLARLLAAGAFAAAMVPQTPVYAAPHPDQWQHILDCLNWMINDPARHRAECSPGHEFFIPGNFFSSGGVTGAPPPSSSEAPPSSSEEPPPPSSSEESPPSSSEFVGS